MKRIIITEEEKERILDMHKSAILSEQPVEPARTTMGLMSNVRQQQRDVRQDLRTQQKGERQDMRQAAQNIRQDARAERQDARAERQDVRQDARAQRQDARQEKRQETKAEILAKIEDAKNKVKAELAARKEARQEKKDIKQLQSEIAAFQKTLNLYIEADKNRKASNPQDNTYAERIKVYQTALQNLQANLQSQTAGQQTANQ